MKKIKISSSQASWARLILLAFALVNTVLVTIGLSPVDLDEQTLNDFINLAFLIGAAILAGWRNNNVTKIAQIKESIAEEELAKAIKERELMANRDATKANMIVKDTKEKGEK